jgi:hypothetical protein
MAKNLITTNLVTDQTKQYLQKTIDFYEEQKNALDQITSALTEMVGQLGTNISDSLVQAFEDGTDAAKAFGTAVSGVLGNIVKQDLFQAIFGKQLDDLSAKLKLDALNPSGNISSSVVSDIKDFYNGASSSVGVFEQALKAAEDIGKGQGFDLFPSATGSRGSLTGGIQASLTEDTGSVLVGTAKGIQLSVLQISDKLDTTNLFLSQDLQYSSEKLATLNQINMGVWKIVDNTIILPSMASDIKQIAKSSSDSAALSLRAAGKFGYVFALIAVKVVFLFHLL